eukprot:SAG22_NODE_146_length_17566_cov_17.597847_11_plen_100_part_00
MENNIYIYGDYTSPFDGRHPDGTDSWAEFISEHWSRKSTRNRSRISTKVGASVSSGSYDAPFCALSAESCVYNATTKTQTQVRAGRMQRPTTIHVILHG